MKRDATVVVHGVRQAGALVDATPVKLRKNSAGDQKGTAGADITDPVSLVVSMVDEPGDAFEITLTIDQLGSVTRKGTMRDDFDRRHYDIPFKDFE